MMTTYTRRGPGQTYLKNVLSERINKLIEHKDLDLEINPLKARLFIVGMMMRSMNKLLMILKEKQENHAIFLGD